MEHPMLFKPDMVYAILEGRKTQTRRIIKQAPHGIKPCAWNNKGWGLLNERGGCTCKPVVGTAYHVGDKIWVREKAKVLSAGLTGIGSFELIYDADGERRSFHSGPCNPFKDDKWTPGIHMPRWASRITLEIVNVKAEPLQMMGTRAIDPADFWECYAEGIPQSVTWDGVGGLPTPLCEFVELWDSINKDRGFGWDTNPYVWVLEFRRVEK